MEAAIAQLLGGPAAAEAKAQVFAQLKPICSQLLFLRGEPQLLQEKLDALALAVTAAHPTGLQACFDYVMYPLMFMLESVAAARTPASSSSSSSSSSSNAGARAAAVTVPAMKNDLAAEAALQCVLALLLRVRELEQDQVLAVLQGAAGVLALPPGTATEEMRLKVFKVIAAVLGSQPEGQPPQQHQQGQQAAPLQQPATAPLAGMLISSCLAAAEREVAAAGRGSKALRHAVLQALQAVVAAVRRGPGLACFLPGLASGLAKQLLAAVPPAAGVPVTGAASSSASTVLILQVMTQAITMTLGDTAIQHIPDPQQQQQHGAPVLAGRSRSGSSSADVLAALQQLSLQASSSGSSSQQLSSAAHAGALAASSSKGVSPPLHQQEAAASQGSFTVQQDEAWLASSSSKVQALLAMTLPRLLTHPQPAVRTALASSAAQLLRSVSRALSSSRQAMLEILLTLANDDYQQVSQVAVAALKGQAAGGGSSSGCAAANAGLADSLAAAMAAGARLDPASDAKTSSSRTCGSTAIGGNVIAGELLVRLCVELPGAVRRGEASGAAAAQRAAAAVLCSGPPVLLSTIFSKPSTLCDISTALLQTFQLDPSSAALLLRAQAGFAGGEVTAAAAAAPSSQPQHKAHDSSLPNPAGSAAAAAAVSAGTARVRAAAGHPLLPRMPLSLQYLTSLESYKAAAGLARALGRCARLADTQQQAAAPAGEGCEQIRPAPCPKCLGRLPN
ncbi:hypothetical protein COO60DRAFT_1187513 [Scenedesmus sp. NREL 46B-D3]|nr:hypothetical protein COO60DRAFT_1187513 [Scenedesmus sp. NREL 46B-D3]